MKLSNSVDKVRLCILSRFRNLESLSLQFDDLLPIDSRGELLFYLSVAKGLRNFEFKGRAAFMDVDFWADVLENINPLSKLESVSIYNRDSRGHLELRIPTVKAFLRSCPNLRRVNGVAGWSRRKAEKLTQELRKLHYDIDIK